MGAPLRRAPDIAIRAPAIALVTLQLRYPLRLSGFLAWMAWAAVPLEFLATVEPSRQCLRAVGVDVSHGTARLAADRESPRIEILRETGDSVTGDAR